MLKRSQNSAEPGNRLVIKYKGRRKGMYSPKISEKLIPYLYRKAKEKKIPMTAIVNGIIQKSIKEENRNDDNGEKRKRT